MKFYLCSSAACAVALSVCTQDAYAGTVHTLTFDETGFQHGLVVSTTKNLPGQVLADVPGVSLPSSLPTISVAVKNRERNKPDVAVIFDTRQSGTEDSDLEAPFDLGNLVVNGISPSTGNILIIQEVPDSKAGEKALKNAEVGDILDKPDDEGSRPAGWFNFSFDNPISSFGFDLIDVEEVGEFEKAFYAVFESGNREKKISFKSLSGVEWGDNSLNRIAPITAEELGLPYFDRVKIALGGSGGVDNITFMEPVLGGIGTPIPSPAAAGAGLLGLLGLITRRRRSK